jgi:hypothetical protein
MTRASLHWLCLLVVGGAAPGLASAQAPAVTEPVVMVRGVVLEQGTRQPLPGAVVSIADATDETDEEGRFSLAVGQGRWELTVQLTSYAPVVQSITVGATDLEQVVRLSPSDAWPRYETVVRPADQGSRPTEVSGDEARASPGTLGDPFRVIGSLPGVAQVIWPAAIYAVRGANPGNTGFFLDGIRVPALFHLALGPSVIHPYLIGEIEFHAAAPPARFGRYVSGVVSATTADAPTDRVHASADVRLYDAGGAAASGWNGGRGTVMVGARYSYTAALFSAIQSDTSLQYGDYQLRIEHRLGPGRATLFVFGSLDELGSTREQMDLGLQFHRVDLRWTGAVGGGRLRVAQAFGADASRSTLFGAPIRARALSTAPRAEYKRELGQKVSLSVGADAEAQRFGVETDPFGGKLGDLAAPRSALAMGAYASVAVRVGRLTLVPGVRGDQFFQQGAARFVPQPRLSLELRATDALTVRASGGRFAQMPSLPVGVPGFESFGLADYGLQESWQAALGATLAGRLGSVDTTAFYQHMSLTDLRELNLRMLNPLRGNFLVRRPGRGYGVELMARLPHQARFHGWLAYTLSRSTREVSGIWGPSAWDQRHILNLVAGYRLPSGFSLGSRLHYHTGRNVAILDDFPTGQRAAQQRRLPGFFELDLRVERRFRFDRFLLDVYAEVANVTRSREVAELRYASNTSDEIEENGYEVFLPSLGVHAEF